MPSHCCLSVCLSVYLSVYPPIHLSPQDREPARPCHSTAPMTLCPGRPPLPLPSHPPLLPRTPEEGSSGRITLDRGSSQPQSVLRDLFPPGLDSLPSAPGSVAEHHGQAQYGFPSDRGVGSQGPSSPEPHVVRSQLALVLHGGVDLACGTTRSGSKDTEHGAR